MSRSTKVKDRLRNSVIISGACIAAIVGVATMPVNAFSEKGHSSQGTNALQGIDKLKCLKGQNRLITIWNSMP